MNRTASVQHSTNESIKNQCWWHQSTNNERSHSNYCEQHQYQCAEHQQPMCSASADNAHSTRLPYARFLQSEYFHFSQYVSHSCHSARSRRRSRRIHPSRNYALPRCGMTVFEVPSPSTREVILHIKEPSPSGRGGTACRG